MRPRPEPWTQGVLGPVPRGRESRPGPAGRGFDRRKPRQIFSRALFDDADTAFWSLIKTGVDVLIMSNGMLLTKGDRNEYWKRQVVGSGLIGHTGKKRAEKSELVCQAWVGRFAHQSPGAHAFPWGLGLPGGLRFEVCRKAPGKYVLNAKADVARKIVGDYLSGESM